MRKLPPKYTVIMGMGKTGIACLQFLLRQNVLAGSKQQAKTPLYIMDNRPQPPNIELVRQTGVAHITGYFDAQILAQAQEIILSPGLAITEPALKLALASNVPIISEIELFSRYVDAPVAAITGSNGKSTVTTLLGEMAKQAGWDVRVGGNLGTPAIELLSKNKPDAYILELSSFQLETTYSLKPQVAAVLNISADHLDRYASFADYLRAKQRIYANCKLAVINADDALVVAMLRSGQKYLSFSLHCARADYSICKYNSAEYFVHYQTYSRSPTTLLPVTATKLPGRMMQSNMLAALALADGLGIPMQDRLDAMQKFTGLAHRCQLVNNNHKIDWFNDSKGTNVGATIAAIQGLNRPGQIILIAGGEGKGADFTPLAQVIAQHIKFCILLGRDAKLIAAALEENSDIQPYFAKNMQDAVLQAKRLAQAGDAILLSPACASFDMFQNYEHRGQQFVSAINELSALP
jgi:UDP-N-acetylmuramoylalanine--D-glutamate ligase